MTIDYKCKKTTCTKAGQSIKWNCNCTYDIAWSNNTFYAATYWYRFKTKVCNIMHRTYKIAHWNWLNNRLDSTIRSMIHWTSACAKACLLVSVHTKNFVVTMKACVVMVVYMLTVYNMGQRQVPINQFHHLQCAASPMQLIKHILQCINKTVQLNVLLIADHKLNCSVKHQSVNCVILHGGL